MTDLRVLALALVPLAASAGACSGNTVTEAERTPEVAQECLTHAGDFDGCMKASSVGGCVAFEQQVPTGTDAGNVERTTCALQCSQPDRSCPDGYTCASFGVVSADDPQEACFPSAQIIDGPDAG